MEDLIRVIVEKTGISEQHARTAVETVVTYLKGKLPAPLAAHIDSALGAAGSAVGHVDLGGVASTLGGLLGKK